MGGSLLQYRCLRTTKRRRWYSWSANVLKHIAIMNNAPSQNREAGMLTSLLIVESSETPVH
jgi:hypothetical protein